MAKTVFRTVIRKALAGIGRGFLSLKSSIDIRDIFVFGGLSFMGYGLGMYRPWVGVSVTGATLMALGLGWLTRGPVK